MTRAPFAQRSPEHIVRVLRADEHRAAMRLTANALHSVALSDEQWQRLATLYRSGPVLGAFDAELIGVTRSTGAQLVVPGGGQLAAGLVVDVAVRADRTRRGVMTDLIETQLRDMSEDGLTVAVLKASEAAIWRRFGYGVSTRARTCSVNRRTARLRREVPADGQIELLSDTDAKQAIPRIYAGLAEPRAGMITRTPYWWAMAAAGAEGGQAFAGPITTVVHHGPAGPDGFAIYLVRRAPAERTVLRIVDMHTSGSTAFGALWRYLLGVDLVDEIAAPLRPTDEPIELLFTDQRVCQTTSVSDERWLRLIDVPAALTTRAYQGEAVVIEVTDPLLVQNCGTYRVGAEGVQRTGEPAQLQLDVASLADIYLGAWRPSMLAQGGLIGVRDPAALAAADRLFAGSAMPWCGTILL